MKILEPTTDTGSINMARREDDTILPRLNRIFTGHVGAAPSPERHEQQCREALAQATRCSLTPALTPTSRSGTSALPKQPPV